MENNLVRKQDNNLLILRDTKDTEFLQKTVETLASLNQTSSKLVFQAITQAASLGIYNPVTAFNLFWYIGDKAMPKSASIKALVTERKLISTPIVIRDAEIQYYWINNQFARAISELTKEYVAAMNAANAAKQQIQSLETFMQSLLQVNLVAEPPMDKGVVDANYQKTTIPIYLRQVNTTLGVIPVYERITTLGATNNRGEYKEYNYKLSTAINLDLYIDKDDNVKKSWNNLSKMMKNRCFDHLLQELAIDPSITGLIDNVIAYGNEEYFQREDVETVEEEI